MTVSNDQFEPAPEMSSGTGNLVMVLCQTALGIAILFVWQGVSGRLVDNFFISNPIDVGRRLMEWTLNGSIFLHLWATIYATTLGFVIGAVIGAVLGIWLGISTFASRLLNPYLNALNALPKVALAPLFVLWFGLGIARAVSGVPQYLCRCAAGRPGSD